MKIVFAKLFELGNHQVLITKEEEDSGYYIAQSTEIESGRAILTIGFEKEEKRNEQFDRYSETEAMKFINVIEGMNV